MPQTVSHDAKLTLYNKQKLAIPSICHSQLDFYIQGELAIIISCTTAECLRHQKIILFGGEFVDAINCHP